MKTKTILLSLLSLVLLSCQDTYIPSASELEHTNAAIDNFLTVMDGWKEISRRNEIVKDYTTTSIIASVSKDGKAETIYYDRVTYATITDGKDTLYLEANSDEQSDLSKGSRHHVEVSFATSTKSRHIYYNELMKKLAKELPHTTRKYLDFTMEYYLIYATPYKAPKKPNPSDYGVDPEDAPAPVEIDTVLG